MRSILLASVAATALCLSGPMAFAQEHSGNMGAGASTGTSADHGAQRTEGGGAVHSGRTEHQRSAGGAEQMHRSGAASAESQDQHSGSSNRGEHNGSMRESNGGGQQHTDSMREHNAATERNQGREHNGSATESNRGMEHTGSTRESGENMHRGTAESHGTARGEETRGAAREGDGSRGTSAHEGEARGGGHGGRNVHLSSTQHTRFVDSIRSEHVSVIDHASFDVNVGVVVPTTYHFYPLPEDIVTFVPEYRGYDFIVVAGNILVIDPASREIVDVIPEG